MNTNIAEELSKSVGCLSLKVGYLSLLGVQKNYSSYVSKNLIMTFGERITLIRKQFNWSQADLTKKIGTSAYIIE